MKIVAKKDRKLLLINTGNTQNENKAETIELTVPEEYENYNKKIVFVTDNGIVWDIIQDNTYKLTKAITKYKQVDFYIWLTKYDVDFRTETRPLRFYYNKDASGEITPEEISGVNTVVNILEEEITKVDSLETELRDLITDIQNKLDNGEFDGKDGKDGQDGYTPQKGIDYFTQQDKEEIEGDILNEVYTKSETDTLLEGKADVEDIPDVSSFITKDVNNLTNYTLKTNTGSLIDLEINDTTYVVTLKLKNQDGTVISTDTIDLPLESVVVSGRYDNTTKKVILTLENGSEVDFSVADLVAGLQTEITSQNKLASDLVDDTNSGNKFVTTSEKQTWNNKLDESDLTDYVKNTDYATNQTGGVVKIDSQRTGIRIGVDGTIRPAGMDYSAYKSTNECFVVKSTLENVIAGKQLINQTQLEESQESQDEQIERLKATLPTTTGEGQDITLDKTAELEFKKPPLPMGNTKQNTTEGYNLYFMDYTDATNSWNGLTIKSTKTGYIINGTCTQDGAFTLTVRYMTLLAGTYTIAIKKASGLNNIGLSRENYSSIVRISKGNTKATFTLEETTKVCLTLVVENTKVYNEENEIMIYQGTTEKPWEEYTNGASPSPSYPQTITNVTGDVEVVVGNKNLFKISNYSKTGWNITIDNPLKNLSAGNYTLSCVNKYITANKGMTVYFTDIANGSMDNKIGDVFVTYDFGNSQMSNTKSITQEQINANYIIIGPQDNLCTQEVLENMQIMIEKSSSVTTYTPHQQQTLPLTLGNIELCKIGDYQDYFYKESNKWYLHNEIAKLILDGTESGWDIATRNDGTTKFFARTYSNQILTENTSVANELSNYFTVGNPYTSIEDKIWLFKQGNNTTLRIGFKDQETITTVSEFKEWLSTHNTELYYPLATPTDTEITDTTLISQLEAINNAISYEEQTNISSNTIALFNVEAYQSTKLVLEEMATAIVALGGV